MKRKHRVIYREPGLGEMVAGLFAFVLIPFLDPFDYYPWVVQEKKWLFWYDYVDKDGNSHAFKSKEAAEQYIKEHLSKD